MRQLIPLLSLLSFQAFAIEPYVTVGLGAVFPSQNIDVEGDSTFDLYNGTSLGSSIFQLPNIDWKGDLQTGIEASLAVGIPLNTALRMEGEFLYQNMQRDMSGSYDWNERYSSTGVLAFSTPDRPLADSNSSVNVYSLMTNLIYDFHNSTAFTPFIGAGIGIGWIHSEQTTKDNILITETSAGSQTTPTLEYSPELYGTAFAWQFKVGLNYEWKDQMSFDLVYRLFATSQFEQKNTDIETNPSNPAYDANFYLPQGDVNGLLDNSIYLAFRYPFH